MDFKRNSAKFFFLIFLLIVQFPLHAQIFPDQPRLVIGIVVDGLQEKHIDLLWHRFDANGFKKIIEKGTAFENMEYNIVSAGNASDIATLITGTTPYYHGVTGNNFYSRKQGYVQSVIFDENEPGIGTKQTVSAHQLLASTITDELMLTYPKQSKTYAIAINAEDAIMLGGHTANSAMWLDDINMKWVTTSYYTDGLAASADEMNVNGQIEQYASSVWEPMYSPNTYLFPSANENKKNGFQYFPNSKRKGSNLPLLKNTPNANALVADLALKIFEKENLGQDAYPDMLLLQFNVKTPYEKTFALKTAEKEDMYLRLDKDLQYLFQKIDSKIGLSNTLIFILGTQTSAHTPLELGENKIPAGYFNGRRSMALLNTYLMVLYGQERWVEGYYGKNIFLNRQKIEEKKINLQEIQQVVADFMHEFEGIQSAYTSYQIVNLTDPSNREMSKLRNSFQKSSKGDVIITLLPGWLELDDNNNPIGESNAVISSTPVYFYGWNIEPKKIATSHSIIDIAPTICKILKLPFPNATTGKPLEEIINK